MNPEQKIKQKILATLVIFFMFVMIGGTIDQFSIIRAATDTANLLQNIVSGDLFVQAQGDVGFNDQAAGTGINSLANLTVVNVIDNTGSAAGWDCVGGSTNFINGAGGNLILPNLRLMWAPGDIDGPDLTGVAAGPDYTGNFGDGTLTLINAASGYGSGSYNIANTSLNILIETGDYAEDYNATLTFTLS